MLPELFRQFIKPYYARIGAMCREQGVNWWLHSCGNDTDSMDDLAEVGLDVFRPLQKGTMDEVALAREYGDTLMFLVSIHMQYTLWDRTPPAICRVGWGVGPAMHPPRWLLS